MATDGIQITFITLTFVNNKIKIVFRNYYEGWSKLHNTNVYSVYIQIIQMGTFRMQIGLLMKLFAFIFLSTFSLT